jgi:hypothetical protein
MSPAQAPAAVRWILPATLVATLGALPLTWVNVTTFAGFELQVPYVMAMVLGTLLCLSPSAAAVGLRHLPAALAPWLVAYALYLVILSFGLAGGASKGIVLRQIFFLLCGLSVALAVVATGGDARVLRRGGLLAIAGFLALTEVLARQLGLGWGVVVTHFLSTGDLEFVFYHFLKDLFQLVAAAGAEAKASDKNVVAVAILTAIFLLRAGHTGTGGDRIGRLATLLGLGVLVILNTRSVLIMAALGLPLAGWLGAMRSGIASPREAVFKTLVFLGLTGTAVMLLSMDTAAVGLIGERLSFADDSAGNRFEQYAWALERIEAAPLTGSGLGEFQGQPVHNLFLGAWMHAGLLAFLLVVFSYLAVATGWIVFVLRVTAQPGYWVLPARPEWIAVLPLLPLFRVWIAGDAGHPSFVEWTTLCLFFALALSNRLARGRTAAPVLAPAH